MGFQLLHQLLPEIAQAETRTLNILKAEPGGLPAGEYAVLELYCADKKCDCRRVMLSVVSRELDCQIATLNWGWEPIKFYRKRFDFLDEDELIELKGPSLLPMAPQTELAEAALEYLIFLLDTDPAYGERIVAHYKKVKQIIDGPGARRPAKQWGKRKSKRPGKR